MARATPPAPHPRFRHLSLGPGGRPSAARDARALAARLSQGKCNDVTLKLYADLDHLFKPCGGRPSNMQMYFEKRDVDKVFIADTVDWLKKH